jgi:hypothetical protein
MTGNLCYDEPFDYSWEIYITHNGIANAHTYDYDAAMRIPNLPPALQYAIHKVPMVQALSESQRDSLSPMLTLTSTERITADEILQHHYLTGGAE